MNEQSDSLTVTEDGSLELGDSVENIIFHQDLNVFLVTTKENNVRIFDPHSHKLADVPLAKYVNDPGGKIRCIYHGETGGVILAGGKSFGVRQDHQGVLLLHTILQTQVSSPEEVVTLEILLSEALQLQHIFSELQNIENANEVKEALAQAISDPLSQSCSNSKVGKWRTVCLSLPLSKLRSVCSSLVRELRHLAYFIPALSLASALCHRLNHLAPALATDDTELDKEAMFSEAARLATFMKWPHMNYKWALPDQMAQAGFFHQPVASDDDRAMCFICNVCLVYWEPTDEPWSEHERHSPNCPYVKGEYTHNVPLSVTHATNPALMHSEREEPIHRISESNSKVFMASATKSGNIVIWNVAKQLKKEIAFLVDPSDSTILDKHFSDTIGYTDVPLQPVNLKTAWGPPPSGNQSEPTTLSNESSKLMLYPPPSICQIPNDLFGNTSQEVPTNQTTQFDYTNDSDKEYSESPMSISQFITISDILRSNSNTSELNQKSSPDMPNSGGHKPMTSSDESNEIDCLYLEEVLQLENLALDSMSLNISKSSSSHVDSVPHTPVSSTNKINNVGISFEDISDELFAPPRPSHDVRVTSLCVFSDPMTPIHQSSVNSTTGRKNHRACLVVGVGLRRYDLFGNAAAATDGLVKAMNDVNQAEHKEKSLDIMTMDSPAETSPRKESNESIKDDADDFGDRPVTSNVNTSSFNPKNFVPYLLVYDLSQLIQIPHNKEAPKNVPQGPSKKSSRKVVPSSCLLTKIKGDGELSYEEMCVKFPVKYKSANKSFAVNTHQNEKLSKRTPKCAQCIPLPHKLNKLKLQLIVDRILISPCGQYLLVSLQQFQGQKQSCSSVDGVSNEREGIVGGFVLYMILSTEAGLSLQEEPVSSNLFINWNLVAKEMAMIPNMGNEESEDDDDDMELNLVGVICMDGCLRVLSLSSLEYIQVVNPPEHSFNNVTYCHSLERLCVTREDGKVLLLQIRGHEDSSDTECGTKEYSRSLLNTSSKSHTTDKEIDMQSQELLVHKGMTEENLDKCVQLTLFQSGCPKVVATVPPCWSEVIQAQKKRRNPQHLQHQSEDVDSARTWRLESDRTTHDEHMLDLLLPLSGGPGSSSPPQIGHIDVKLNFVSGGSYPLPKIQITLLKQNLKSSRRTVPLKPLDNFLDLPENPVLTRDFLLTHKAEILCGPVNVNQYIDLSGQGANLTLTSPDLFACKGRSFLIHIKAIKPNEKEAKKGSDMGVGLDLLPHYVPPQSSTFFERPSSSTINPKRGEAPKGCDAIQELTLTVHCCTKTTIPHERLQRLAMINKVKFHSDLIGAIVNPISSQHIQHRALDILLWILSIHTASEHNSSRRDELLCLIKENLTPFVKSCILGGDRSLAHKITKIVLTALENFPDPDSRQEMGNCVLRSMLECLDGIAKCKAAGAVYWFFSLLNHVKWCDPLATVSKITELVTVTSEVLSVKMNPFHSILETKFGLEGKPFERELFDTFPPLLMKQSNPAIQNSTSTSGHNQHNSTTTNGNNNLNTQQGGFSFNKVDCPNILWFGSTQNIKSSLGGVLSPLNGESSDLGVILGHNGVTLGLTPQIGGLCGLFEVEPLHFTLYMASDGTKMERVFSGSSYATSPFVVQPTSNLDTDTHLPEDNSKVDSLSMAHMQLNKAIEDMEHMVIKNHAVTLLLSKKAKKSYLEKLKKSAKQKASKVLTQNSTAVMPTATEAPIQNGQIESSSKESIPPTTSSTPSTTSSDTSPEGVPNNVIAKQALSNSVLPNEVLGNIVEGVANTIFNTSMLNSSINLLANVTNDIPDQNVVDTVISLESEGVPIDKVMDMLGNMEEGTEKEGYNEMDFMAAKLNLDLAYFGEIDKMFHENLNLKVNESSKLETDKDKMEKSLEELSPADSGKTSTASTASTLTKDTSKDRNVSGFEEGSKSSVPSSGGLPYQQLLSIPPQQMIVIERMHSGARRFVILDFGAPVILTDVIIPACGDLVSLTIDIWLNGEEIDGERLAVASDIGLRPLILADLQPPPLCRFLKVTALGRYGMVTSQCKIPVGAFYGHTVILPWYLQPTHSSVTVTSKKMAKNQLSILSSMVEDVSCRYGLACSKLKALLQPYCVSTLGGGGSNGFGSSLPGGNNSANTTLEKKIYMTYQECLTEQQHLNLILSVMKRLQKFIGISTPKDLPNISKTTGNGKVNGLTTANNVDHRKELENCSSDQLSSIVQALLNCLLTLAFPPPSNSVQKKLLYWCGPDQAKALIENVCIKGPKGAQVAVVSLLARLCTGQPWWGEFLASTLVSLFSSRESNDFPATRLFALMTFLGQKSVQCGRGTQVIDAVLQSLLTQLQRGSTGGLGGEESTQREDEWLFGAQHLQIDPTLISWLLLFLSLCLDLVTNTKAGDEEKDKIGVSGRWSWLTAESSLQKKGNDHSKEAPRDSRDLLRKRLVHHKQQLVNLESATKSFDEVLTSFGNVINPKMFKQSEQLFKKIQKQHALKHYKDLCSIQRNETNSLRKLHRNRVVTPNVVNRPTKEESHSTTNEIITPVDRVCCLSVIKALISLLMNTQYPCSVDTFLLTCKVIGGLVRVTRPSLRVGEFLDENQLVTLLIHSKTLDSAWGSPWAIHALTCLLQDVLEGERLYGSVIINLKQAEGEEMNATDNNKENQSSKNLEWTEQRAEIPVAGGTQPVQLAPSSDSNIASVLMPKKPKDKDVILQVPRVKLATPSSEETNEMTTQEEQCSSPAGDKKKKTVKATENGGETAPSLMEVQKSTVSTVTSVNQSATATNPPAVNVATSHFATIEEEDGPGKYNFLESDESSASDDMMEFISDLQADLHSLTFPNSTTEFTNIPTSDSYNILPNPLYCSVTPHAKQGGKDSRVSELMTAPLALHKHKMGADHSTAVDARLESGISLTAELRIHMMNAIHASRLCSAISAPLQISHNENRKRELYSTGNLKESVELLSRMFQNALSQMAFRFEGNQLESILEIWLSLNLGLCGGEYSCSLVPIIPLHPNSISALLTAVTRSHSISIRCWCLILQSLTLCSNLNPPDEASSSSFQPQDHFSPVDLSWMAQTIIADRNFLTVLLKLLSGHYSIGTFTRSDVVGSTLSSLFEDFLVRLEVRCDVISPDSVHGNNLKLTLLKLVMRLLEPDAPLARGLGPLDLQKTLLTIMLSMHYSGLQKSHIILTIINSVASVVNGFLCSNQEVLPGSPEPNSSVLGGLFASVLGSDGQQGPVPTRKMILCALLNLSRKLLEIPIDPVKGLWFHGDDQVPQGGPSTRNNSYQERYLTDSFKLEQREMELSSGHASQTDEHKAMNPSPAEETGRDAVVVNNLLSVFDSPRRRGVTHASKECCHSKSGKFACIADTVLENNITMNLLVDSLRCSESNSVVPMNLIGIVSGDVSETLGIGKTLPDALYQVLLALNQKATKSDLLINAILRYISPNNHLHQPVFSEALYCFYTQVLDCEKHLKKFADMNGTEILWENLVKCVGTSSGPQIGLVSSVMNHLSPALPVSTMTPVSHKRIDPSTGSPSTVESANTKGLYNFAPLAVVTSSNPTARPADALVKSTQFFQRTKSPPWSYHFYPEENWVDLNLTLPCPILLHEIQIQPHTMSLGMCPSGISLETSVDGGGCSIPVTGLVCTAGLTCIYVVLRHPVVASVVIIRLHRPRDQSTLGLTHLKLLGTTTFKNSSKATSRDHLWEHGPQKSSYWWLRLVDHCMFDVPGGFKLMLESGSRVDGVMEAMVTLLATSSSQMNASFSSTSLDNFTEALTNNNYQLINTLSSTLIENTTLALVTYNQDLLHGLVKCLFRHPLMMQSTGSSSVDAAIALLCMVSSTTEGVKLLIDWFSKLVDHQSSYASSGTAQTPSNVGNSSKTINHKILHCFASILWNVSGDVTNLITDSLFKKVYSWCEKATGPVKEGLDCILCSLCKVQPHLFTHLLLFMGFLTVIDSSTTSLTDDRKDREAEIRAACTDDMKESTEGYELNGDGRLILQDPSIISITPHHLQSISFAAQSPSAIHLMLDSGFPLLLVHGILEWCKAELLHQVESCTTPNLNESSTDFEKANLGSPSSQTQGEAGETSSQRGSASLPIHDALPPLSTSMVVHTLKALTNMCSEIPMKDWLGSGEGSVFWIPLLTVLGDPVMNGSEMTVRSGCGSNHCDYSQVEDATIQLMKVCCNNHDHNRKLLAGTLCHLIQRQNTPPPGGLTYLHSLSGFTRRLVLQILLETECVLVHVTSTFCLSQPPLHTLPPQAKHSKFGAGNKTRLMYLPVTTKIEEVIKMVTDWWQQGTSSQSSSAAEMGESGFNTDPENGSYKKEIREVGLELVDKLSVAAGVTAKDKRMKDKGLPKNKRKETATQSKQTPATEKTKRSNPLLMYGLIHEEILNGTSIIPESLTLGQVIAALWHHESNGAQDLSQLKFNLVFAKDTCQECSDSSVVQTLLKTVPKPSMLSVFSSQGGLSILAQHMALLYPDSSHQYISSLPSKNGGDEKKEKSYGVDSGFQVDMFYATLPDYMCGNNVNSSPGISRNPPMGYFGAMPIPPHALGSFTLFLRLPGYAETLLADNTKACCLLRLALGAYDENNTSFVGSLATLPFQVLEVLLKSTPLTTDDGLMLRKTCLAIGVLHLILACLAALSHQDGPDVITSLQHPNVPVGLLVATAKGSCPQRQSGVNTRNDSDRCHYWAKGTGFGTGSTNQSWNVEQALVKQKMEEQHVVWLIKLLAQYINPGGNLPEDILKACEEEVKKLVQETKKDTRSLSCLNSTTCSFSPLVIEGDAQSDETCPSLPSEIYDLFVKAGLVRKICSYLSNDSVLDMSRHVPLYQALMALVRGIAVTPSLAALFFSSPSTVTPSEGGEDWQNSSNNPHLPTLLTKMKRTVNTYVNKLKWKGGKTNTNGHYPTNRKPPMSSTANCNDESSTENQNVETNPEDNENEDQGLSLLVPDIQLSTKVVEIVMERLSNQEMAEKELNEGDPTREDSQDQLTPTDIYLNSMKPLQFDSFEMIVEDEERGIRFVVPYHYENLVRDAGEVFNPKRMKRLAQEAVTLSTSLPLSYSSSVFVRTDMDRLDVMKVLITGPEDTPYANGCFEFDVYFTNNYPNSPLYINLQTTGEKRVRFNPNLYQDGKVCLSILNTWHGRPEEKWNPQTSSLLQVLVSIQSLILVPEPYFNEPGYERSRGSQAALHNSQEYDANIKAATIRWAILNQLRNPSPCFKDVIERHFWLKRKDILTQVENWIIELEAMSKNKRAGRVIPHHAVAIKKLYHLLLEDFGKMVPPKGLENVPSSNFCPRSNVPTSPFKDDSDSKDGKSPARHRVRKTSRADIFGGNKLPVIDEGGSKALDLSQCEPSSSPPEDWEDPAFRETFVSCLNDCDALNTPEDSISDVKGAGIDWGFNWEDSQGAAAVAASDSSVAKASTSKLKGKGNINQEWALLGGKSKNVSSQDISLSSAVVSVSNGVTIDEAPSSSSSSSSSVLGASQNSLDKNGNSDSHTNNDAES